MASDATKLTNLMLDDLPVLGGKYEEKLPGKPVTDLKALVKNEA